MSLIPASTATPAVAVPAGTWTVDPAHTTIEFRVRHVGLARVRGVFRTFEGQLVAGEDGALRADGSIAAGSLDTGVAARDAHLRSADFFDVERHPVIAFTASAIEVAGDGGLRVAGELTIRGTTRPIVLDGELLGHGLDDEGNERVGLELSTRLDRRDFGLTWNGVAKGGNLVVADRVDVHLEVSALRA